MKETERRTTSRTPSFISNGEEKDIGTGDFLITIIVFFIVFCFLGSIYCGGLGPFTKVIIHSLSAVFSE
ncbi:MAG: hypothetical protein WC415_04565 [Patescibacteria group bacterium]